MFSLFSFRFVSFLFSIMNETKHGDAIRLAFLFALLATSYSKITQKHYSVSSFLLLHHILI